MKTVEIKGFWGLLLVVLVGLAFLTVLISAPVFLTWYSWNILVAEAFHGPAIGLLQAALLTAIIGLSLFLVYQPQISFQFKRVNSPEEIELHLRQLKEQDSTEE